MTREAVTGERLTTVALPGGHVARVRREGSGTPVLFAHSVLPPAEDDRFVEALAGHFDVVAPLAPGYADLAELDDIDDVHDLALYYDDLLRALDLGPVDVVGHSSGGMAAAELAAHVPDRVRSLTLISPFGFWDEAHPTEDLATVGGPNIRRRLARGDESLFPPAGDDPASRTEEAVQIAQAMTAALKFLWPFPDQGLAKRIHRVACPSLVVWGRDDDVNPLFYASRFADALGGARVEVLDGGHLLPYEAPDEVAKLVFEFVEGGR